MGEEAALGGGAQCCLVPDCQVRKGMIKSQIDWIPLKKPHKFDHNGPQLWYAIIRNVTTTYSNACVVFIDKIMQHFR